MNYEECMQANAHVSEAEGDRKAIHKGDLSSGMKTLVSGVNRGSGEAPAQAVGMTLDTHHDRLILAELWGIRNNFDSIAGEDYGLVMEVDRPVAIVRIFGGMLTATI